MKRNNIYNHINDERDYQDLKWDGQRNNDDIKDKDKSIAEWINYMEYHILKAKENIYYSNKNDALAEIRKVTALGVRCMEIYGCPRRIISKELIKKAME